MRHVIKWSRGRKIVLENYQRELTTAETEHDLYYAYINEADQVEIGSAECPAGHMILGEDDARAHYCDLRLEYAGTEIFLLYNCYEGMKNMYILGALYPFHGRREEILCTSSRKMPYHAFWLAGDFYLCVRRGEEGLRLLKKERGKFLCV